MDTFFCPIGVWIREVPLYNAQDTSLIWTLSSVPLVSGLEEFRCTYTICAQHITLLHSLFCLYLPSSSSSPSSPSSSSSPHQTRLRRRERELHQSPPRPHCLSLRDTRSHRKRLIWPSGEVFRPQNETARGDKDHQKQEEISPSGARGGQDSGLT